MDSTTKFRLLSRIHIPAERLAELAAGRVDGLEAESLLNHALGCEACRKALEQARESAAGESARCAGQSNGC
ncbi:MAG: hypothetical protein JSU00_09890 [Acidobacteria bacterium]|nr:hypothetical protein [Acidobacteriota bacterium]